MEEYEDDGTWVWVSFAPEHRIIVSFLIGSRKQVVANKLIQQTAQRLLDIPLFTSDGLRFYKNALLNQYGILKVFPKTGKRGRPKKPKLVPPKNLRYGQVIKIREQGRLKKVIKKVIFGYEISKRDISTSLLERQNLTFRQDNNRVSRKTIGFSKADYALIHQFELYTTAFNFCRGHGGLIEINESGNKEKNSPMKDYGRIDHNWSLKELLTFSYHKTSTN